MTRLRRPSRPRRTDAGLSRAEQKQHTRQALLDAALELMASRSFDGLSLREIAHHAGVVPTAFYRHFESVEELGLVLVADAFRALRLLMRAAREVPLPHAELVQRSVTTFAHYVQAHRAYFRFVVRERFGGSAALRTAIRSEVRLFVSELSADLMRFSPLDQWPRADLQMLATLIVTVMIGAVERLLDDEPGAAEQVGEIMEGIEKQLRLVLLGAGAWTS